MNRLLLILALLGAGPALAQGPNPPALASRVGQELILKRTVQSMRDYLSITNDGAGGGGGVVVSNAFDVTAVPGGVYTNTSAAYAFVSIIFFSSGEAGYAELRTGPDEASVSQVVLSSVAPRNTVADEPATLAGWIPPGYVWTWYNGLSGTLGDVQANIYYFSTNSSSGGSGSTSAELASTNNSFPRVSNTLKNGRTLRLLDFGDNQITPYYNTPLTNIFRSQLAGYYGGQTIFYTTAAGGATLRTPSVSAGLGLFPAITYTMPNGSSLTNTGAAAVGWPTTKLTMNYYANSGFGTLGIYTNAYGATPVLMTTVNADNGGGMAFAHTNWVFPLVQTLVASVRSTGTNIVLGGLGQIYTNAGSAWSLDDMTGGDVALTNMTATSVASNATRILFANCDWDLIVIHDINGPDSTASNSWWVAQSRFENALASAGVTSDVLYITPPPILIGDAGAQSERQGMFAACNYWGRAPFDAWGLLQPTNRMTNFYYADGLADGLHLASPGNALIVSKLMEHVGLTSADAHTYGTAPPNRSRINGEDFGQLTWGTENTSTRIGGGTNNFLGAGYIGFGLSDMDILLLNYGNRQGYLRFTNGFTFLGSRGGNFANLQGAWGVVGTNGGLNMFSDLGEYDPYRTDVPGPGDLFLGDELKVRGAASLNTLRVKTVTNFFPWRDVQWLGSSPSQLRPDQASAGTSSHLGWYQTANAASPYCSFPLFTTTSTNVVISYFVETAHTGAGGVIWTNDYRGYYCSPQVGMVQFATSNSVLTPVVFNVTGTKQVEVTQTISFPDTNCQKVIFIQPKASTNTDARYWVNTIKVVETSPTAP